MALTLHVVCVRKSLGAGENARAWRTLDAFAEDLGSFLSKAHYSSQQVQFLGPQHLCRCVHTHTHTHRALIHPANTTYTLAHMLTLTYTHSTHTHPQTQNTLSHTDTHTTKHHKHYIHTHS